MMGNGHTHIGNMFKTLLLCALLSTTVTLSLDSERRICGYGQGPICCPGWYNNISAPCSIPSCDGNCGDHGQCIRPNTCLCADRSLRFSCDSEEPEMMQHDQPSANCIEDCNRRGRCVAGTCECEEGFSGKACQDVLESACFAKLQRGLCVRPIQQNISSLNVTMKMSKEYCCNSFGIAWGEPCQLCRSSYCGRGYVRQHGSCRDIDECQIPGVCRNGKCINHEGSFTCNCPAEYMYDEETLECKPQKDICEVKGRQCLPGGKCVRLSTNEFKCLCNWNYLPSPDQKSCIQKKALSFDVCALYSKSICKNGVCIPRGNSYECQCNEGFEASIDKKSCQHKIDVCALHRGYLCPNGECVSVGRDFYCKCNPGFTQSFNRRRCLNPCEQMGPNVCVNGQCIALPYGDYECQCYPGYESTHNKKHCALVDDSLLYGLPSLIPYANDEAENSRKLPRVPTSGYRNTDEDQYWNDLRSRNPFNPKTTGRQTWSRWNPTKNNPCRQPHISERCAGGICLNLGGTAYQCECPSGFESYDRGRYCEKRSDHHTGTKK